METIVADAASSGPAGSDSLTSYRLIPLDQITPSPHQARKDFDPAALQTLADSMKAEGLLEPIIVRSTTSPLPNAGEGEMTYFELVSGERRLRAAKLLGWQTIEAKVIQTVSEAEAAAKGLVENLQRQDLNPIEEAEGFSTLNQLDQKYWTQDKIARIAGHDRSYISQSLGLLKLDPQVQADVRRLTLSRSHGLEIMRLPQDKQAEVGKKAADLSIKETRKLVDGMLGGSKKLAKMEPAEDPFATLWANLQKDSGLPPGSWEVKYHRGGSWTFTVHTQKASSNDFLREWFQALAKAIPQISAEKGTELDTPESVLAQIKATMPPDLAAHLAKQYAQIAARPSTPGSAAPVQYEQDPGEADAKAKAHTDKPK